MNSQELQNKLDTSIQLILQAQQQIGLSIGSLNTTIGEHTAAMHALHVENAKLGEKVRTIVRDEMQNCPAYKHFDELNARTSEITGVVSVLEQKAQWAKERLDKRSNPPRSKAPWWAPPFVRIAIAIIMAAGGLGAWGFTCSTTKAHERDTARGAKPPVASITP